MKNILKISAFAGVFLSFSAFSADVEVKWHEPDNYKDIYQGSNHSKSKFREKLFNQLTATIEKNAKELPENYKLEVTFLDVDLAGKVSRGTAVEIRQVRDYDFPRLHFYMVLRDENGSVVFQGEQNLKEKKDKHKAFRMKGSQTDFYLEKSLINKWFEGILLPAVNKEMKHST